MECHKFKKVVIVFSLTVVVFVSLFFPQNARAQVVTHDPIKFIFDKVQKALETMWKTGGAIAYRNALNFYLGEMAKQTAEWVATGGKGKKPMFISDPNYWSKLGDSVLGDWINQTAKSVTGFQALSLCDPMDPTIKFNMLVGMDVKYQEMMFKAEERCSWSTIKARAKEASKKKLFDFSAELKEGQAARYRQELAARVQAGQMPPSAKAQMLEFIQNNTKLDEKLKSLAEKAKTVVNNSPLIQDIKKEWDKVATDYEELKDEFKKSAEITEAKRCINFYKITKGDHEQKKQEVCEDIGCRKAMGVDDEETCKNDDNFAPNYDRLTEMAKTADLILGNASDTIAKAKALATELFNLDTPPPKAEDYNQMYNPEATDVATTFQVRSQLWTKQAEAVEKSKFMQGLAGDINRLTTKVSNQTLTPASGIRSQYEESIKKGTAGPLEYTEVAAADALGIFTNTLASKLLKQLFEKGFNPNVSPEIAERVKPFLSNPDELFNPTQEQGRALYADLSVSSIKSGKEITIEDFSVCPSDRKYALSTNCLLDENLKSALDQRLTIKEAMDKQLLNPNEIVGAKTNTNSLLSYPNVKKLRRYRIFPLGLEIAAKKIYDDNNASGVSIETIVNGFNDSESEYYHLVDPNWVLKPLSYKCNLMGYTAVPVSESFYRQEGCVDLQDCIHEREDGQCDAWGYCTREKNIWRFNGDPCEPQYNTCQTYVRTKDRQNVSYLKNTLERCDANNVGCQWYCSKWDKNLAGSLGNWACITPEKSKEFLGTETCSLDSTCNQEFCLCQVQGTNNSCLVSKNETSCSYSVYHEYPGAANVIFFNGKVKNCDQRAEGCHEYIRTAPKLGTNLVFNGDFEIDSNEDNIPDGWTEQQIMGVKANPLFSGTNVELSQNNGGTILKLKNIGYGATWLWQRVPVIPGQEYTVSFNFRIEEKPVNTDKPPVFYYFDSVQTRSYYDNNNVVFANSNLFKYDTLNDQTYRETVIAPPGMKYMWIVLVVWGNDAGAEGGIIDFDKVKIETGEGASEYTYYGQNNKIYLKNALSCKEEEVGCEFYQPIVNKETTIAGIVKDEDKCSFNCLGYETFYEMISVFDLNTRLVNLIPSTAQVCSAPGCEEFTNLGDGTGRERREYYSYLRQCVKIDNSGKIIMNENGEAPSADDICRYYYTWIGSDTAGYQLKKYYLKGSNNGPGEKSQSPFLNWGECENESDAKTNAYCKQFYDEQGNIFYRLYPNTISCSEDCSMFRRTADQSITMALGTESEICSKKDAGCREYKGSAAANVKNIFSDDFEGDLDTHWVPPYISLSNESLNYPGKSLFAQKGELSLSVKDLLTKNKTYFVSFWFYSSEGKKSDKIKVSFSSLSQQSQEKPVINSGKDWQQYKFGPFYLKTLTEDETLIISGDNSFYIDNFVLEEVSDTLYLIKDSWQTPCECDTLENHQGFYTNARNCTVENTAQNSKIGCQAYQGRDKQTYYLKSFSRLCSDSVVGCEALIDTQNSSSPFEQTFNSGKITVPADQMVYLINSDLNKCQSKDKGCQKFGQPKLDADGKAVSYKDVYLVNDPDSYENVPIIICAEEAVGCEDYNDGGNYFKNPGEKICNYDKEMNKWVQNGTNSDCPNSGWVKTCPADQSGCTKFIDPLVKSLLYNPSLEIDDNNDKIPDGYEKNDILEQNSDSCTFVKEAGLISELKVKDVVYDGVKSYKITVATQPLEGYLCSFSSAGDFRIALKNDNDFKIAAGGNKPKQRYYGLKTKNGIQVDQGKKYTASAYVKVEEISSVNDGGGIYLERKCYSDVGSPSNDSVKIDGSKKDEWQKVELSFTPEKNMVCYLHLYFNYNQTGTIYIDKLDFKQDFKQNSSESGTSYYYLNNDKLDKKSCEGRVGLKQGCVLFNDTSRNELLYDAMATYALSEAKNGEAVNVQSAQNGSGDTNVILKVQRDRVCGEWLSCRGWRDVWDKNSGTSLRVCDFIGRCNQLGSSKEGVICTNYVAPEKGILDEKSYKDRNILWSDMDYAGYSILDLPPVETLRININNGALTYDNDNPRIEIEKTCQLYPEKDSPFKNAAKDKYANIKEDNVCMDTTNEQCQCAYKKVEYSGTTRYFNITSPTWLGLCITGRTGASCRNDNDCNSGNSSDGKCSFKSKEYSALGLKNFCLEKDESLPNEIDACLSWWPGMSEGGQDIFQRDLSAAYTVSANRSWYCYSTQENTLSPINVNCSYKDCCLVVSKKNNCETHYFPLAAVNQAEIKMKEIKQIDVTIGASETDYCDDMENLGWVSRSLNEENNWCGVEESDSSGNDLCNCNVDSGGAAAKVQACFGGSNFKEGVCENNNEENFLKGFLLIVANKSAGDGSGGLENTIEITLKNGCQYLFKVPTGDDNIVEGAYRQRLWPKSSYYNENKGSVECEPYGAYGGEISDSEKNNLRLVLAHNDENICSPKSAYVQDLDNLIKNIFSQRGDCLSFDRNKMKYISCADKPYESNANGESPTIEELTINGQESGDIKGSGAKVVNLEFYAWADENQMPIREIVIDWLGDGTKLLEKTYNVVLKNYKEQCKDDDSNKPSFGNSSDGCVEKKHQFTFIYYCEGNGSSGWEKHNCKEQCCFKPQVKITDNWGKSITWSYDGLIKISP